MKPILLLLLSLLTQACCILPADTGVRFHGYAPKGQKCVVKTINSNSSEVISQIDVSGEFTRSAIFGVCAYRKVDLVVECNGSVVREVKDVSPGPQHWSNPIELGNVSP